MEDYSYSAGMVSRPFWFIESKKVIELLKDNISYEEIRRRAVEENLFGVAKEYRAKEIFNTVTRRIQSLDPNFAGLFWSSGLTTQKALILLSVMKTDRLFFEFLYEVYRGKLLLGQTSIIDGDFNAFFNEKRSQSAKVAQWKEYTLWKLKNSYINFLSDAGMIKRDAKLIELTPPTLDDAVENYLKTNGMRPYLNAITGRNL